MLRDGFPGMHAATTARRCATIGSSRKIPRPQAMGRRPLRDSTLTAPGFEWNKPPPAADAAHFHVHEVRVATVAPSAALRGGAPRPSLHFRILWLLFLALFTVTYAIERHPEPGSDREEKRESRWLAPPPGEPG